MGYVKQNFVGGQILTAEHMNHIEEGIAALAEGVKPDTGDGISETAKKLLLTLFENAVYKTNTMQTVYNALRVEWGLASDPVLTPLYKLDAPKIFVQSKKEFIDTGLKPFETLSDSTELTIITTFSVMAGTYGKNSPTVLIDCFTEDSSDKRGIIACTWGYNQFGVNVYSSAKRTNTIVDGAILQLVIQVKGGKYRTTYDGTFGAWDNISNYGTSKTVPRSLLIGASWSDGYGGTEKARYFGGTVYNFQVFDKLLTDEQIKALMEVN